MPAAIILPITGAPTGDVDQQRNPENPVRFGVFEADLSSGELRKSGVRLRLSGQPFQVLAVLLRNPGKIVNREELKQELWPDDTFVDFENGVNTAIRKIRRVLDDSADTPRYVETLPRRGYRFIGPVDGLSTDGTLSGAPEARAAQMPPESPAPSPTAVAKGQRYLPWLLFALSAVALLFVSLLHFRHSPAEAPSGDFPSRLRIFSVDQSSPPTVFTLPTPRARPTNPLFGFRTWIKTSRVSLLGR